MPKRARCPHCGRLFNRDALDGHIQHCRAKTLQSSQEETPVRSNVIVDGNNVAYHLAPSDVPRAVNLALAMRSLKSAGYRPVIVVSAALIHKIDKPNVLREMIRDGHVAQTSKGQNDDLKIIKLALDSNADIVSNDRFLNWLDKYPWISSRLLRYRMTPSGLILI